LAKLFTDNSISVTAVRRFSVSLYLSFSRAVPIIALADESEEEKGRESRMSVQFIYYRKEKIAPARYIERRGTVARAIRRLIGNLLGKAITPNKSRERLFRTAFQFIQ